MRRLSRLSRNSGSSSDGSSRTSLFVNSTRPSRVVVPEQRPEDAAGDALDEVVAVEERCCRRPRRTARASQSPRRIGRRQPGSDRGRLGSTRARERGRSRSRWRATTRRRVEHRLVVIVERHRLGRSRPRARRRARPSAIAGTASRLSAPSSPGSGISRPGPTALAPRTTRAHALEYLRIWRRLPTRIGGGTRRGHADRCPRRRAPRSRRPRPSYPWLAIV